MKIVLGSDHVGLVLKREIQDYLSGLGIEHFDVGAFDEERTDYPLFGSKAARLVASGEADRGIIICGTGIGISISANKVPGVRCVVCSEPYSAALSRAHNDTNVLALGARVVGVDLAKMIVQSWLDGEYEGGRHARRVQQLADLDRGEEIC